MNWNITAGRPAYVQLIEQLDFKSRRELLKVPRLGARAFEQAAGFLRVVGGTNPLDNSAVHPESYHIAGRMAADAGVNPNTMQRALQDLESRGLLQAQRTAGRTVTANDTVLQALRRKRAATLARDFLQQMHALGMTATEVETLLRETETSEKE